MSGSSVLQFFVSLEKREERKKRKVKGRGEKKEKGRKEKKGMKLLWLCCLVLVLGVVVEGQNPPKVGFENLHDKEVTVYWDQF